MTVFMSMCAPECMSLKEFMCRCVCLKMFVQVSHQHSVAWVVNKSDTTEQNKLLECSTLPNSAWTGFYFSYSHTHVSEIRITRVAWIRNTS